MIHNFEQLKQQLNELSPIINSFKSETVQLKLVELVFAKASNAEEVEENLVEVQTLSNTRHNARKTGQTSNISGTPKDKRTSRINKSGRLGPGAMVQQLIDENFFKTARTGQEIIEHCKTEKVATYIMTEIAVALGRAVKNLKLKREKNKENQFVYTKR